jgi:hypothetical protein
MGNRGWFRPGEDSRRHQLTRAEQSRGGKKGFQAVLAAHPTLGLWLLLVMRAQGRRKTCSARNERRCG